MPNRYTPRRLRRSFWPCFLLAVLQNKLTRAQYLDEVTWTTKSWLGLQKQRISVVLHTAIAEQVVNELACGGGGRVHGAKCLATLAGVA